MKRIIVNLFIIFVGFILQTSVFAMLKLANVVPNILIILISSVAVMRGQKEGMLTGFLCGLLLDLLYSPFLGAYAFLYMLLGFVDGYFNRIYYDNDTLLPLLLMGVNDLVYGLLMYVIYGLLQNHLHVIYYFRTIILPELIYTVAVGLILYRILLPINRWLGKMEKGSADVV